MHYDTPNLKYKAAVVCSGQDTTVSSVAARRSYISGYVKRKRDELFAALGRRCVICRVENNLTFDCIKPTGGKHHKMSSAARIGYYWKQARLGNLQVLCHECNSRKGAREMPRYVAVAEIKQNPSGVCEPDSSPGGV
jgi:hypothetical protein